MSRSRSLVFSLTALLLPAGYLVAQQDAPYLQPRAENPTQSSRSATTQDRSAAPGSSVAPAAPSRTVAPGTTAPSATAPPSAPAPAPQIENRSPADQDAIRSGQPVDEDRTQNERGLQDNIQRRSSDVDRAELERRTDERRELEGRTERSDATQRIESQQRQFQQSEQYQERSVEQGSFQQDRAYGQTYRQGETFNQGQSRWNQAGSGVIHADPEQAALGVWITHGPQIHVVGTPPNSPAAEVGIQAGDRILSVDGKQFSSAAELIHGLSEMDTNDDVEVEFMRNGQRYATSVQLRKRAEVFGQQQFAQRDGFAMGQGGQPYRAMRPMMNGADVNQLQAEVDSLKHQVQQLRQELRQMKSGSAALDNDLDQPAIGPQTRGFESRETIERRESQIREDRDSTFPNDRFTPGPPAPPENLDRRDATPGAVPAVPRDDTTPDAASDDADKDAKPADADNDAKPADADNDAKPADADNDTKPADADVNRPGASEPRDTTLPPPAIPEDGAPPTPEDERPQD